MRRKVIMLVVTVVVDRRHVRRARCARVEPPGARPRPPGRHSIVLFPVKGSDLSTLDTAVDDHPQPRRRPRHRRARRQPPGQHHRHRPARREERARRPTSSSARPPSCGSGRCRARSRTRAVPSTTTTVPGATTTTVKGATTTTVKGATTTTAQGRDHDDARATTTTSGNAAGAAHDRHRADRRDAPRRPTTVATARPAPATTTTTGASRPRRSRARPPPRCPRDATTATCQDGKPGHDPTSPTSRSSCPTEEHGVCYVLGPTILTGTQRRYARARSYDSDHGAVGRQRPLQEQRLRRQGRRAVRRQAGRDRARRRRAVGADDQPGHHRPATCTITRQLHEQSEAQQTRARAAVRLAAGAVRPASRRSQSVSPTLGKDQLHAGIVAGLIGLGAGRALHDLLLPAARPRRVDRASRSPG